MAVDMEALAAGMSEEIKRQGVVLESYVKRNAELAYALREINDAVTKAGNDERHTELERGMARGLGAIVRNIMRRVGV